MKKIAIAVLLAATLAAPAHAEFYKGSDLYNKMNGEIVDRSVALGYIIGIYDAYVGLFVCHDMRNLRARDIEAMVRNYLSNNPAAMAQEGYQVVRSALQIGLGSCRSSTPQPAPRAPGTGI